MRKGQVFYSRGSTTEVRFPARPEYGLHNVQTGFVAHPTYSMGTGNTSSVINRPRREADHSPPGVEVNNVYSYNPTPPRLQGVVRLKTVFCLHHQGDRPECVASIIIVQMDAMRSSRTFITTY